MDSVIFVQSIATAFISKHLKLLCVNILYALSYFCNRNAFAASNKKWYFIEGNIHIMNSFCKDFFENGSIRHELDEFHFFRQINVTASCVLLINRCDHDLVAKHQLVFNTDRHLIIWINKSKRLKVHIIIQCSFHIFTIEIWYKAISGVNDTAEIFDVFELVTLLFSCSFCSMVSHQRCKHTECKET